MQIGSLSPPKIFIPIQKENATRTFRHGQRLAIFLAMLCGCCPHQPTSLSEIFG